MSKDAVAPLRAALGRDVPPELGDLPPETIELLVDAVRDRRRHQAEALLGALETSLKLAPRPLRPVMKKLLMG